MRGVINGRIVGDINTYKGIESESSKVTVDNEKKEIKVDVKDEFIDEKLTSKQDKLIPGENIIIDENNVISATGGGGGETYTAGEGILITTESDYTRTISVDFEIVASKENIPTNISELYNDSGYLTGITSSDVTTALGYTPGTSNFSGSYNDLTDKPTIPTVSGTNDGTNWTSLTIGEDTYGFASGGDFNITEEDILDEYEESFIQAEIEIEKNDIIFINDVIITEEDNITINADSTFENADSIYL